jgi:hypothetical protein
LGTLWEEPKLYRLQKDISSMECGTGQTPVRPCGTGSVPRFDCTNGSLVREHCSTGPALRPAPIACLAGNIADGTCVDGSGL